MSRDLLKPKEAAELLAVDVRTLARWADAGKVRFVRTPNGHRRYVAVASTA